MLLAKHTYSILGYYTSVAGSQIHCFKGSIGRAGGQNPLRTDTFIKTYLPFCTIKLGSCSGPCKISNP